MSTNQKVSPSTAPPQTNHPSAVALAQDIHAVRLSGVGKTYGESTALHPLDLTINAGEFLSLLGPSGCGKTTTLKIIAGFEAPTSGAVYIGDQDVTRVPPHRRDVNTVFQHYSLFPHLSVLENVAYGLKQRGVKPAERRRQALEYLELVGLSDRASERPVRLSGGQQQRVALARALVLKPKLLLLDEPLAALDLKLRQRMQVELRRIHQEVGITFVFVTHDQGEAMSMSDRVAVMNAGRVEQLDTPQRIYDAPASRFVATFIGEMNVIRGELRDGHVAIGPHWSEPAARFVDASPPLSGSVDVGVRPLDLTLTLQEPSNALITTVMTVGHTMRVTAHLDTGDDVLLELHRYTDPNLASILPDSRARISALANSSLILGPSGAIHGVLELDEGDMS